MAGHAENAYFANRGFRQWPDPGETSNAMALAEQPVTIKRYAGRRLYHPMGAYLTLDDLAAMIDDDEEFVIREAETGEDITRTVLKQIILERGRHG